VELLMKGGGDLILSFDLVFVFVVFIFLFL